MLESSKAIIREVLSFIVTLKEKSYYTVVNYASLILVKREVIKNNCAHLTFLS